MTKPCARCGEAERTLAGQCIPCQKVASGHLSREVVRALIAANTELIAEMRRPKASGRPPRD